MDKAVIPIYLAKEIIRALGRLRAGGSDHLASKNPRVYRGAFSPPGKKREKREVGRRGI
jgi:hypothetical protein